MRQFCAEPMVRSSLPSMMQWPIALALALVAPCALWAGATEPYAAVVDADSVHLRSGPGTEYYATDILKRGERVEVLGYDAGGWCRVRPPRGSFSLVAAEHVEIGPHDTARIVSDRAEIIVGSRFYARRDVVQLLLDRGDTVELSTERPTIEEDGKVAWYRIEPPAGEYRWIHEDYLQPDEPRRERQAASRPEDASPAVTDRVRRASYEEDAAPRLLGDVEATPLVPVPDDREISGILDQLELGVAALASGQSRYANLALMETDARNVARRAQSASDRNRAEILLRRLDRLAGRPPRPTTQQTTMSDLLPPAAGGIALAQFMSPMLGQPTTCPVPGGPGYLAAPMAAPMAPTPVAPLYAPYAPPGTRHFLNLDFLGLWAKHDSLPALVTTSPIGTPQDTAGVLGQPGTSVLFGNNNVNGGFRPGGRVMGGIWLDNEQKFALEGNYWALATASTDYSATSVFTNGATTDPILARPFFDSNPAVNAQRALLVAYPGAVVSGVVVNVNGSVTVNETSNVQAAGAGGRWGLGQYTAPGRMFLVGGYRFFQLNESLSIISRSSLGLPPLQAQPNITVFDYFSTSNTFNGGDIGLAGEYRFPNRFWFGGDARLAMGNMQETLKIDGVVTAAAAGFTASLPNGLLAQPTNMGTFTENHFALIPSVDLKVGYHLTPGFRLTVGYNFMYVTRVIRPGAQVDTNVNTSQIAGLPLIGPAQPQVLFNQGSIWFQGVTAGFDLAF